MRAQLDHQYTLEILSMDFHETEGTIRFAYSGPENPGLIPYFNHVVINKVPVSFRYESHEMTLLITDCTGCNGVNVADHVPDEEIGISERSYGSLGQGIPASQRKAFLVTHGYGTFLCKRLSDQ